MRSHTRAATSPPDAIAWLARYRVRMEAGGAKPSQALGRLKQSAKALADAGFLDAKKVSPALRLKEGDAFLAALGGLAALPDG